MSDTMAFPAGPAAGDGSSSIPNNDPASAGASGRDRRGRFSKCNPGGPGNPFARRTAAMRQALMDAVSEEDIAAISKKLVEQARQGDVAAARLVFSYVVGKPQPAEDPDRLDEKEWRQYVNETVREGEMEAVVGGMSATLACTIASNAVPGVQTQAAQTLRDELLAPVEDEDDDEEDEEDEAPAGPANDAARHERPPSKQASENAEAERRQRMDGAAARLMALLGTVTQPAETAKRAANPAEEAGRRGNQSAPTGRAPQGDGCRTATDAPRPPSANGG
jgi:hypothetical protein